MINKRIKQLIYFTIIIIVLCFCSIFIFTLPSNSEYFDLTVKNKNSIGDVIAGLTAPIIGIASSILLYLALSRQTDANFEQRLKNESDIIFLLFNQLDNEIANFYHKVQQGNKIIKVNGLEGLHDYSRSYRFDYEWDKGEKLSFGTWYEADQIILLIDSYNLIEKRIEMSTLSLELKNLFNEKLNSYYNCKFKIAFSSMSDTFDLNPHLKDAHSEKVQELVKKHGGTAF